MNPGSPDQVDRRVRDHFDVTSDVFYDVGFGDSLNVCDDYK